MAVGIVCESCGRIFQTHRALLRHYSYDVPAGVANGSMVNSPEEAAEKFPERARCGNHQEILARLAYYGWASATGVRDDFFSVAE
jgi:hypothetical protein